MEGYKDANDINEKYANCDAVCESGSCMDHMFDANNFVHSENCDRTGFQDSFWLFYQFESPRPDWLDSDLIPRFLEIFVKQKLCMAILLRIENDPLQTSFECVGVFQSRDIGLGNIETLKWDNYP